MMNRMIEEVVYRLSMRTHAGGRKTDLSHRAATFSVEKYDEWRDEGLRKQFESHFLWDQVKGKCVLDFGCGGGQLSFVARQEGARSVLGVDVIPLRIARATAQAARMGLDVQFKLTEDPKRIDAPDGSIDVILCFDVMEHVMDYEEAVQEWMRVLAPGGTVLIWWSVWWHPYGHHLQTMIPLPWVHTFMSDESLFRVLARIYDSPQFEPRIWHFDEGGKRIANPYRGQTHFKDLNKLTIRRFDAIVARTGLRIKRKEVLPFTGNRLATLKKMLVRTPWPDFFTSRVIYELEKPARTSYS
jgi:SAM-dependent methyltransferase